MAKQAIRFDPTAKAIETSPDSTTWTKLATAYLKSKAGIPTTSDLADGEAGLYKNTSDGSIKWYVNDSGSIKAGTALT